VGQYFFLFQLEIFSSHDSYTMVGTIGDERAVKIMVGWIGWNCKKLAAVMCLLFIGIFLFSCFLSGDTIYYTNQCKFLNSTNVKWASPTCFSTCIRYHLQGEHKKKPYATAKLLFIGSLFCSSLVVDIGYMEKVKLFLFYQFMVTLWCMMKNIL
jgi:hypothetical protein